MELKNNLAEKVPEEIVKKANLDEIMLKLYDTLSAWQEKNTETINKFFNQKFFKWEGLMYKLCDVHPWLTFTDIEEQWVNLALIQYYNRKQDFKNCMNKISPEIKKAFIQEIFEKVGAKIWTSAPYNQFARECKPDSFIAWTNPDVLEYFQKIVNYLNENENKEWAKKTIKILANINITNQALNSRLWAWQQIPSTIALSDPGIPSDIKDSFDALLSFEMGKAASLALDSSKRMYEQFSWLFSNSLPAINTIITENDEYKYDERKLKKEYPDYKTTLEQLQGEILNYTREIDRIRVDTNLFEQEKETQINELERKINEWEEGINKLRWDYYIMYLKKKNISIGNTLEELRSNNFDYSKISDDNLEKLLLKIVDLRLEKLVNEWVVDALKLNYWSIDEFKNFYKELANPKIKTLHLKNVNILWSGLTTFDLPINKTIVEWANPRLNDIEQYWWEQKFFDAIPIRYEIKKSDIDSDKLNISLEDREKLLGFLSRFKDEWDKYVIDWPDVWLLLYLFFIINSESPITQMSWDEQKKIEELFGEEQNTKSWEDNEESAENTESEGENQESSVNTIESFKKEIESCWTGEFEDWSEIWLPMWNSKLGDWWYQWMKIKISNVDMTKWTFTGKVFWSEFEFKDIEWKTKKFKMNQKLLDDLNKISKMDTSSKNKFWLLPNPDNVTFNSFIENSLKDNLWKHKLWTNELKFPPMDNVLWKDNQFVWKTEDGWEVPNVQYFCTANGKSTYKVEHKKNSFTVSSVFMSEEEWKDGKKESKLTSYKRDMDWNNFLIFFTQKWLKTRQTKEDSDLLINNRYGKQCEIVNSRHLKLNRFSINNIKNGFKNIFSAVKKHLDEYDKRRTEDFQEIIEEKSLNFIPKWIRDLIPSLWFAIWQRLEEIYAQKLNTWWKRISRYLDDLKEDPQFGDTFGQTPSHVKWLYWKSYKQYIVDLFTSGKDTTEDEKRKCAALLLVNIDKWSSPYRNLTEYKNKWLWVKLILWPDHYKLYMEDREKCIQDLRLATETKEKERLQSVLARSEMDYIINNVWWENYALPYFKCREPRWDPQDPKHTSYIPNSSKLILSNKFADELKNAYTWWCSASAIQESYWKISHGNFIQAKADFLRFLKSWRDPKGLANLKSMIALAKTPETFADARKYFLICMLSWVLDMLGTKDVRELVYELGTTIWFLPGMLAKKTWHSQEVAILLDDFCEKMGYKTKFSDKVNSYFKTWDLKDKNVDIAKLIEEVDARWDSKKMEDFDKYSKIMFRSWDFSKKPILQELQKDVLKPDTENIDNSLLGNTFIINQIWLFSNQNVVRSRLTFDHQWLFTGNDDDERGDKEAFWKQVKKDITELNPKDINHTKLVLNQFLNRFNLDDNDKKRMFQRIKTANHRNKKIWKESIFSDWTNMWKITKQEIDSIMRYAIKWTIISERFNYAKIPPQVNDALDAFQTFFEQAFKLSDLNKNESDCIIYNSQIAEIFGINNPNEIKNLHLWSWESYNDVIGPDNKERSRLDDAQTKVAKLFTNEKDIINTYIAKMFNLCERNRQTSRFSIKNSQYEENHKKKELN